MNKKNLYGVVVGLLLGILLVMVAGFVTIKVLEKDGIAFVAVKENKQNTIGNYLDPYEGPGSQNGKNEGTQGEAGKDAGTAKTEKEKSEKEKEDQRLRAVFDQKLTYIMGMIDQYYMGEEYDKQEMYDNMLAIMVATLGDPYSYYYTAKAFEEEAISDAGNYTGIGSTMTQNAYNYGIYILQPYEGSPAEKAGLQPYDRITEVNGKSVENRSLDDVVREVRGEAGTSVSLTIIRGEGSEEEETIVFDIVRENITLIDVNSKLLEDDIGYIYISAFNPNTDKQFTEAVDSLIEQGAKAFIFDLRGNGGGDVDACNRMLDYILPMGEMKFFLEDKNGKKSYEYVKTSHKLDMPMAVLVDSQTASASEIFTGAVKDNDLARIFGTTSYGKGIIQMLEPLPIDNSAFQITVMKYYTPSGACIHGEGIEPDEVIELDEEYATTVTYKREEDNQRDAAVEYLKEEIQKKGL